MKSFVLAAIALVFVGHLEAAEGVQWRSDYSKAVQEAAASNRPLLLDFGTKACVYCRKLDATTFRDPTVIRLLNERFVPVKIDGDRDPKLVQAMRIESYPTLVVAGPDGSVLAMHPGYLDANEMNRFLQGGLAKLSKSPERVSRANTTKSDEASTLLHLAKKDFQEGFYLCCVERCDRLIRLHPTAAECTQARQLSERATTSSGDDVGDLLTMLRRPR